MKPYKLIIEEVLAKEVTVLANSKQEAIDKLENRLSNSDIILDSIDFIDTIIREYNGIFINDVASALYCLLVTLEDNSHGEYESFILNNTFYPFDKIESTMEQFLSNEKQNFLIISNITLDYENHIFTIDDTIHNKHLKIEKITLKI